VHGGDSNGDADAGVILLSHRWGIPFRCLSRKLGYTFDGLTKSFT